MGAGPPQGTHPLVQALLFPQQLQEPAAPQKLLSPQLRAEEAHVGLQCLQPLQHGLAGIATLLQPHHCPGTTAQLLPVPHDTCQPQGHPWARDAPVCPGSSAESESPSSSSSLPSSLSCRAVPSWKPTRTVRTDRSMGS